MKYRNVGQGVNIWIDGRARHVAPDEEIETQEEIKNSQFQLIRELEVENKMTKPPMKKGRK